MKRFIIILALVAAAAPHTFSQDFDTAQEFFAVVAERYSSITDYIAEIEMTTEEETLEGTLYYRRPNLIRINFSEPEDQVLVSDGSDLKVYIPEYDVVLNQRLGRTGDESVSGLASSDGLRLMRENYSIAYLDSPDPVPLDDPEDGEDEEDEDSEDSEEDETESDELVTKLRLTWRSSDEGFRQLTLSIDEDRLIRRISGVTANYEEVQFDFLDVRLNQNIPESRFDYEEPASANSVEDFLFEREG
ncbi:MAG: LolA family protein [Spirochaetota bacterium]